MLDARQVGRFGQPKQQFADLRLRHCMNTMHDVFWLMVFFFRSSLVALREASIYATARVSDVSYRIRLR